MGKKLARILLVDDNDVTRSLLRGMLRGEDYEIVGEANNGVQGFEMAIRLQPDIICLDVEMPGKNGIEVLGRLRTELPHATILMVTGHTDRATVLAAAEGGANGYIVKPFNAAKVLDTLFDAASKLKAAKLAKITEAP
jgi:two-component system chemotaxis response regulator CheY